MSYPNVETMTDQIVENPLPNPESMPILPTARFMISLSQEVRRVNPQKPALALLLMNNPHNENETLEAIRRVSLPTDIIGLTEEGTYGIIASNTQPLDAVKKALHLLDVSPDSSIGIRIFHRVADAGSVSSLYGKANNALREAITSPNKVVVSAYNKQQVPIKELPLQDQNRVVVTSKHK